jgi:peroxiredoxin Q/BCP
MSTAAARKVVVGKPLPAFSLPGTGGGNFKPSDARGSILVLYFYPRDNTPGCTLEGQEFQQLHGRFKRAGAVVYGVSRDTLKAHEKFCERYGFGFELLADPDEAVCNLFDVMRDKNMYGKKVRGIERSTFLVDAKGVLRQEWRKLKVEGHAAEVLSAVQSL